MLPFLPAPGADDDGSGTVTILAALKSLVKNGYTPLAENGVEVQFHWYSAEGGSDNLASLRIVFGMPTYFMWFCVARDQREVCWEAEKSPNTIKRKVGVLESKP
jgi:hypothetical protein